MPLGKCVGQPADLVDLRGLAEFGLINTRHRTNHSLVAMKVFFKGKRNFPQRGARARGVDGQRQQIARRRFRRRGSARPARPGLWLSRVRLYFLQALDLGLAHRGVVHFAHVQLFGFLQAEQVHADDGLLAGINAGLAAGRRLFDAKLGQPGLDGFGHAAKRFHFLNVRPRPFHQRLSQRLDIRTNRPTDQ